MFHTSAKLCLSNDNVLHKCKIVFINPLHPQNILSPNCSSYNSWGLSGEFVWQSGPFLILDIFLYVTTFMFDSAVMLYGDNWSQSLLEVKGSKGGWNPS